MCYDLWLASLSTSMCYDLWLPKVCLGSFFFFSVLFDPIATIFENEKWYLRASVVDVAKKNVILTHQKPTLLFYHIILQHPIYQMFYHSILYIKIIYYLSLSSPSTTRTTHPPLLQQRPPTATTPASHHRHKPTSTNATLK